MKSIIGLSIVVAALIVVAQSTTYPSSFGSFEGTTVRFWDFGATTFGQSAIGQTYSINVLVNGTLTPASNDGSTGEYQPLLCANVSCPIIVRFLPSPFTAFPRLTIRRCPLNILPYDGLKRIRIFLLVHRSTGAQKQAASFFSFSFRSLLVACYPFNASLPTLTSLSLTFYPSSSEICGQRSTCRY